uniref:THD domain-containing protein n=2 Tax=Eptatretus burgeri TaxID=7764 RepID=A0A8C4PWI2_EPTBU
MRDESVQEMSTCAKRLPPILVLIALLVLLAPMACRFAWDYSTASRRHQQFQSMFVWPRGWRVRQQRTLRSTAQLSTAEPSSPSPECRLSMVHLITHANDIYTQGDRTIIFWTKTLQCGDNIQAEKKVEAIRVTRSGMYFIYNQIMFKDERFTMGQVVWRRFGARRHAAQQEKPLLQCVCSMPEKRPNQSCYTAGIVRLGAGDEVAVIIPSRGHAHISANPAQTFFGVMQLT